MRGFTVKWSREQKDQARVLWEDPEVQQSVICTLLACSYRQLKRMSEREHWPRRAEDLVVQRARRRQRRREADVIAGLLVHREPDPKATPGQTRFCCPSCRQQGSHPVCVHCGTVINAILLREFAA